MGAGQGGPEARLEGILWMGRLGVPDSGEPWKGLKQGNHLVDLCYGKVNNGLGTVGARSKGAGRTAGGLNGPSGQVQLWMRVVEQARGPSVCVASRKTQTASCPSFPQNLHLGPPPGIWELPPLWAPWPGERVPWAATLAHWSWETREPSLCSWVCTGLGWSRLPDPELCGWRQDPTSFLSLFPHL